MRMNRLVTLPLVFFLLACSEERESHTVLRSDIVESVYSSVEVEPVEMYRVNSTVVGYIDELFIEEGDKVEEGELLFRVRDIQSRAVANNAKLTFDLAKKNYQGEESSLQDLRMELNSLRLKLKNDSLNYFRIKKLAEKELVSSSELEQSELMYQSSKSNVASLENRIQRLERELKTSFEQAKNNYMSSLSHSEDASGRSVIDGLVYELYKQTGELVGIQEPIALVGSKDTFLLELLVDEADVTKIKLGQRIIVTLEAYRGMVFEAEVTRIAPKMDEKNQTFRLEGAFLKRPDQLYLGMTGEGNIVINEFKDAIVIPLEFLIDRKYVETDRGRIEVETGIESLSHVQIRSGIQEGEIIYRPK